MREIHDQYAKHALSALLRPAGPVEEQKAVSPEAQYVDVHFTPSPDGAPSLDRLGLLGRLADRPTSLEHFHRTPDGRSLVECVRKHLNHRHVVSLRQPSAAESDSDPALPQLWVLSSGRPDGSLRGLGLKRRRGFPPGIYGSPPLYDFGVVAINELREHRSTLLLRLLGAGPTFRRALQELRRLPPEAIEVQMMLPIVVRCYRMAADAEKKTEEEVEFLMETQDVVKEWEQRLRREEREEVRTEAAGSLHEAHLLLYQLRFGVMPDERVKAGMLAVSDLEVLARWTVLIAGEPKEVVDRVLSGALS